MFGRSEAGKPGSPDGGAAAGLRLVLVKPRFPENIGMAARAGANMGVAGLCLVGPELWEPEHQAKARSLATAQGWPLLAELTVADTLGKAVAGCHFVLGTTARTGGWRRQLMSPAEAGEAVAGRLAEGASVALVFGPEDRGLVNEEIEQCTGLVTIPTAQGASSLNLAQAVLVLAYECLKARLARPLCARPGPDPKNLIAHAEQELLFANIAEVLKQIDFLPQDNSDYFLLPVRRFVQDRRLRRNEFAMLMGICRQIKWALAEKN